MSSVTHLRLIKGGRASKPHFSAHFPEPCFQGELRDLSVEKPPAVPDGSTVDLSTITEDRASCFRHPEFDGLDGDILTLREACAEEISTLFAGYRPIIVQVQNGWMPVTDKEWSRVRTVASLLHHPPATKSPHQDADDSPPDEPMTHAEHLSINELVIQGAASALGKARAQVLRDETPPDPVVVYDIPQDSPDYDPFMDGSLSASADPLARFRYAGWTGESDPDEPDPNQKIRDMHRQELATAKSQWTAIKREHPWILYRLGGDRPVGTVSALSPGAPVITRKPARGLREKFARAWESWRNGKQRCRNPNTKDWARYGGRGITWPTYWDYFEDFVTDTCANGDCPKGKTLERPNNDLPYARDNWKWETKKKQAGNRDHPTRRTP
jgi:hypothetical protein